MTNAEKLTSIINNAQQCIEAIADGLEVSPGMERDIDSAYVEMAFASSPRHLEGEGR